ncbi:MAG TPA: hypothetical protein VGC96_01400, partial [Candidatus Elarobacter sp.]
SVVSSVTSRMAGGVEVGTGFESHGFANNDKGTVKIDVIAATADNGLVVDAGFAGEKSKQLPIRIAILGDGRLAFDPKQNVAPEVSELLPTLARGLLVGHQPAAGVKWSTPAMEPATGNRSYVIGAASDTSATISITGDAKTTGPQGFDRHEEASLTYQPKLSAPLRYDTRIRVRRNGLNGPEVDDVHLTATLASDTFAPAGS